MRLLSLNKEQQMNLYHTITDRAACQVFSLTNLIRVDLYARTHGGRYHAGLDIPVSYTHLDVYKRQALLGSQITIGLLTGSTPAAERRALLERLSDGTIQLLIGTHALLSDGVEFQRLGLVITDEQHRFGVSQRSALAGKGDHPHLLVMSATPIPRTLALMIYGDLDISILDELPPGRQKIETYAVDSLSLIHILYPGRYDERI